MNLFIPEIALSEKVIRSAVIYLFLLIVIRLVGKREVGQLSPFDLIVLLIISNVVQDAVIGRDASLGGAMVGVLTILILNYLLVEMTFRYKRARKLLEATPTLLVHNGKIMDQNLKRERITHEELLSALRQNGLVEPSQARFAVLEENGHISVVPKAGNLK